MYPLKITNSILLKFVSTHLDAPTITGIIVAEIVFQMPCISFFMTICRVSRLRFDGTFYNTRQLIIKTGKFWAACHESTTNYTNHFELTLIFSHMNTPQSPAQLRRMENIFEIVEIAIKDWSSATKLQ